MASTQGKQAGGRCAVNRKAMILKYPYYYDIILSDFGRAAAIEYIKSVAGLEQRIIQHHFLDKGAEFYDEYRRIMFSVIADLGYFKSRQISAAVPKGRVDSDILIGFQGRPMPGDIRDRITIAVIEQVYVALNREYKNIRIIIPCNTISPLADHIFDLVSNPEEFKTILVRHSGVSSSSAVFSRLAGAKFSLCTPPALVIDEIRKTYTGKVSLLVLGTPLTVVIYKNLIVKLGLEDHLAVLPLGPGEQDLVEHFIEASVGTDKALSGALKEEIKSRIILPRQKEADNLAVIEACTDIRLGLGINSLDVLVNRSVTDVYGVDGSGI
jgi:hypothetical protein